MRRNTAVILLALALMAAGFLGVLFIGQVVNPPTVPIAVAVVDIPAGATLTEDMVAMDSVTMNPKVIGALIREDELTPFIGSTLVEPVYAYQPLRKSAISAEGNPASAKRLALALSDPSLVAMVVPVTAATAPGAIVEGDFVDLNFGVGGKADFGERLTTEPTPDPFAGNSFSNDSFDVVATQTEAVPEYATPTATPTTEPLLVLPVAKTIVSNAKVLAVIRDERTETVQDKDGLKSVRIPGKIIALVVAIPREAQELVQFSIDNGVVRVSLLSAQSAGAAPGERRPTLGMTWNDLVSIVRMERDEVLALGLPAQVIGPGAYAIEATRNAATQAANQSGYDFNSGEADYVEPEAATATPWPAVTPEP
jgi:Flp pilus assembly protein CpaB